MDDQNRNLILATALSFLVILVWFLLFPPEEPEVADTAPQSAETTASEAAPGAVPGADSPAPAAPGTSPAPGATRAPA